MAAPLLLLHSETPAQTRAVFRDADPRPWGAHKLWCVCARVCLHTDSQARGHVRSHMCMCLYACVPVHVCVHVFMCVYVFLCMCVCTCARVLSGRAHISTRYKAAFAFSGASSDGRRPSFLTLEHVHQGEMLNFVEFLLAPVEKVLCSVIFPAGG